MVKMSIIPNFGVGQDAMAATIAIAIAYAIINVTVQRKISNAKRMRSINAQMTKLSKELNEMIKNKAGQSEIEAKQKEMMPMLKESMMSSFKPMFVILPMFALVYYVLIPALPFSAGHVKGVQELFFITVFIVGFVLAMVLLVRDRRIAKMETAQDTDLKSVEIKPTVKDNRYK